MEQDPVYGTREASDYTEARSLERRAGKEIPQATSSHARARSVFAPYPILSPARGSGARITDVDGNQYIDYHCGSSGIVRGHAQADQTEAVTRQLSEGTLFGLPHRLEFEAAELVNELVPGSDMTKFAVSGTHGTTAAIRLARAYTGRDKIIKFEGMYHGHADELMLNQRACTADSGNRRQPTKIPMEPGVPRSAMDSVEILPWNDIELLEHTLARIGNDVAAIITEPVMGNGGLIWPQNGFLEELREITREHGIVLIFDEVVTGFRLALGGAHEYFGVIPDLTVYGKAIGNGYPTSALSGRAELMSLYDTEASFHGTYSGNPLALAGTKANLEALREAGPAAYRQFHQCGQRLIDGLVDVAADAGHHVHIPDFAGYFYMNFTHEDADPETWTEWRDIDRHVDQEKYVTFARAMIGEGVLFMPLYNRINMTFAHTDDVVEETLEAAKTAIEAVPYN